DEHHPQSRSDVSAPPGAELGRRGGRAHSRERQTDREAEHGGDDPGGNRRGRTHPREGHRQEPAEREQTRNRHRTREDQPRPEGWGRGGEEGEPGRVERVIHPVGEEGNHDPQHGEHHPGGDGGGGKVHAGEAEEERPDPEHRDDSQRIQRADDREHEPPHFPGEGVGEQPEPWLEEGRNHERPPSCVGAPTSSVNRVSRSTSPLTSATVPAARRWPWAMTATCEHIRCTRSITWEETITVPPASTNSFNTARIAAAETGSTDSKGSSSTSTEGACTRAQPSATFLRIPAE